MSKGSLFWANASGKLGETVLYRSGGEQRTRTYVKNIKNPKTFAQMSNRIQMINLNMVYRSLKSILEVSFPQKKSNQSGWNAFVQANKSINTAVVTREGADNGLSVPYNMVLSKGTLPTIPTPSVASAVASSGQNTNLFITLPSSVDVSSINIQTSEGFVALLAALGLPNTAKLTVIKAVYEDEGFRFLPIEQYTKDNANMIAANAFNLGRGLSGELQGKNFFGLGGNGDAETLATFMFSYTDANGKLQVSDARMLPTDGSLDLIEQFLPNGEVWLQVLAQYGYNNGSILSTAASNAPQGGASGGNGGGSDAPSGGDGGSDAPSGGGGENDSSDTQTGEYTIAIGTAVNDASYGSVTPSGMKYYKQGAQITLTAIPNSGYRFVAWGDDVTDNPRTITADVSGVTYSAIFEAQ